MRWDPEQGELSGVPQELLDEVYALRTEVNELHERVDFAERMLGERSGASGGNQGAIKSGSES